MAREAAEPPPKETLSLWIREQAQLKALVVDRDTEAWQRDPGFSGLQRVGGVDVSFVKGDSVSACASLVVLSYPELEAASWVLCGLYLSFSSRNPTSYRAAHRSQSPEGTGCHAVAVITETLPHGGHWQLGEGNQDGNGLLHHRAFGVACHLGAPHDLPCIGVAKKLLQVDGLENNTQHKEKIGLLRAGGDSFPLTGGSGTVLGMALRSHDHSTKPLYVSVGHKISLEAAVRLTRGCCRFRIPEPVRQPGVRGAPGPAPETGPRFLGQLTAFSRFGGHNASSRTPS
ncbi:endonuclease V [Puma concolor]|uniref:Endonuclease V n=1 Tax=Puma concolor TaxID=9696 RepID=A0A6P6I8L6_PUMCO|nr:endonuclease V [Puma concolor]